MGDLVPGEFTMPDESKMAGNMSSTNGCAVSGSGFVDVVSAEDVNGTIFDFGHKFESNLQDDKQMPVSHGQEVAVAVSRVVNGKINEESRSGEAASCGSFVGQGLSLQGVLPGMVIQSGSKKASAPVPEDINTDHGKAGNPMVAFSEGSVVSLNGGSQQTLDGEHKQNASADDKNLNRVSCEIDNVLNDPRENIDKNKQAELTETLCKDDRRQSGTLIRRHTCSYFGEKADVNAKLKRTNSQPALGKISSRAMAAVKLRSKLRRKRMEPQLSVSSAGSSEGENESSDKHYGEKHEGIEGETNEKVGEHEMNCVQTDDSGVGADVNIGTTSADEVAPAEDKKIPQPPVEEVDPKSRPRTAIYQPRKVPKSGDKNYDVLANLPRIKKSSKMGDAQTQIANAIFKMADVDGDGVLSDEEIDLLFRSPILALDFSAAEMKKLKKVVHEYKKDASDDTMRFDEFKEFSKEILKLVYGKHEESKGRWVELEGDEGATIYFNKATGEASYNVPEDYHVLIQTDVFGDAIFFLLEQQDKKKTGLVTVRSFRQLLESISFGLMLSQEDVRQIRRLFKNDRLKMIYEEFVPIAKRLLLLIYQARNPSPFDWCMLATLAVGTFWFNKKTGEARRFPPHCVIRGQQYQLEDRASRLFDVGSLWFSKEDQFTLQKFEANCESKR